MDAKSCWGLSAAIHGTLLVGAALMAFSSVVLGDGGDDRSGFIFRLGAPSPKFARIERSKDVFGSRTPAPEDPVTVIYGSDGSSGMSLEGSEHSPYCCCCCDSGPASSVVAWRKEIASYFDRKLSMATSRRGVPRLKTHTRLCGFQSTGIDADCTCGLIPPKN